MMSCAVLDDYQNVARGCGDWRRLDGKVQVRFYHDHFMTEDELVAAVGDCEILFAMRERTPFTRSTFARLPKLRLLVTSGMRNAAIDLAAAAERGIPVCGTGGAKGGTSELTWGLILGFLRHIPLEAGNLRKGARWQSTLGTDLEGRRLGVIGLGKLGERVAKVGLAFGMQVQAWSQNLTAARCAEVGVEHAGSLDALMSSSDVISVHLVLSERTRGLVGAAQLARMKPDALIVNTSRGPIIDEAALIAALRARRIGGAALDVFDVEPLPLDHPYRSLDNVLATPHIGYVTQGGYAHYFADGVDNIVAWLEGTTKRVLTA